MAVSDYDKQYLSQAGQDRIAAVTDAAKSGKMSWEDAHNEAESVRANAGYSGGRYGNEYLAFADETGGYGYTQSPTAGQATGRSYSSGGGSGAAASPGEAAVTDLTQYLKDSYAQQIASELAALKSSYEQSTAALKAQEEDIRTAYNQARNTTAAQNDLERMRMNEYGAARGLNTGASGQLALSQSAAYQRDIASLTGQEKQSLADNALALAQLKSQYEAAVNQASAQGNAQLSNALYNEYIRQANAGMQLQQLAQNQANWQAQFDYQKTQDALAQQNYLNELDATYAAQQAAASTTEPLLTYPQMISALEDGYITPGVTQAYEYYMGVPYSGGILSNTSSGTAKSGGTRTSSAGGLDYEGLFQAAKASGNPKSWLSQKSNYQRYGFTSSSGLYNDYQAWVEAYNATVNGKSDIKNYGSSYSTIWQRVRNMHDAGTSAKDIAAYLDRFNNEQLTDAGMEYIFRSLNLG